MIYSGNVWLLPDIPIFAVHSLINAVVYRRDKCLNYHMKRLTEIRKQVRDPGRKTSPRARIRVPMLMGSVRFLFLLTITILHRRLIMAMNLIKILGFHGKFIQVCATSPGKVKNDFESMKPKDLIGYPGLYLCAPIG